MIAAIMEIPRERGAGESLRRHREKGVLLGLRVQDEERTLAEIIEDEAGERHAVPGHRDGAPAEMPHVGVEGLGSRDSEDDRPEQLGDLNRRVVQEREAV